MKTITITYTAQFTDQVEVPDEWEWDGTLDQLCPELSEMEFDGTGELLDFEVS